MWLVTVDIDIRQLPVPAPYVSGGSRSEAAIRRSSKSSLRYEGSDSHGQSRNCTEYPTRVRTPKYLGV